MSSSHNPETRKKKRSLPERLKKPRPLRQPSSTSQSEPQAVPAAASGDGSFNSTGDHDANALDYDTNVIERETNAPEHYAGGSDETKGPSDEIRTKDLWKNAFDILRARKPALVEAYQRHLVSADQFLSPAVIETHIRSRLQAREDKQLVIQLGKKPFKVREQGEKVIKFIMWSNTFISAAVSTQPYAALAWSGVSILLPLLLNASQENERMVEGLDSICNFLASYKIKESIYLQGSEKTAHPDCVKAVAELYSNILEYQAHLICHLSKNAAKRGYSSIFKLDEWKEMLEKIKSSDAICRGYFDLLGEERTEDCRRQERGYRDQLLGIQNKLLTMYEASENQRQSERDDDKEAKVLTALASDYRGDKDTVSERIDGTCEWFFADDAFLDWRSKRSGLLWLSAGPGCGKSVLVRALIDEERIRTNVMTTTVCYFFFKDGDSQRMHGASAMSALIHQLFSSQPDLIRYAFSSEKSHGEDLRLRLSELWDILLRAARDPEAGQIICVIDALDECEKKSRHAMIEKLTGFFRRQQRDESSNLTFLITSRPYDDIEGKLRPLLNMSTYVRLDGDDDQRSQHISQDINLVIDAKVQHLAEGLDPNKRTRIADRLKGMNNRTYLWLFLTFDIIEANHSLYSKASNIDSLLSDLPEEVSEAYEKILKHCPNKGGYAIILLQIILAATRPLGLDEINVAMTLATQTTAQKIEWESYADVERELWPKDSFKSSIKNMCGLFVTVHDETVSLIHQTARAFLLEKSNPHLESTNQWQGCLNIATAHGILSTVCFSYLDLKDPDVDPLRENELCCLRVYVALNWATHYTSQHVQGIKDSSKAAKTLCDTSSYQYQYWFPVFRSRSPVEYREDWNGLEVALSFGLAYVVNDYCNEGADINALNIRYGSSALMIASSKGHDQTVQVLLDKGANINQGCPFGNALTEASGNGQKSTVQLLLDKGADIEKAGPNGNALTVASGRAQKSTLQLLLDRGADINAQGRPYGNALVAASEKGHDQIVRLLLDNGADINAWDLRHCNAFIAASYAGRDQVVRLLLDRGANINAQHSHHGGALDAALGQERTQVVQTLRSRGAVEYLDHYESDHTDSRSSTMANYGDDYGSDESNGSGSSTSANYDSDEYETVIKQFSDSAVGPGFIQP